MPDPSDPAKGTTMAIRVNILDVLITEANRACTRCAQGHVPSPDGGGDYVHGVDHVGGEVYAPPEPCPASPLWRVAELLRLQDEADQRLRLAIIYLTHRAASPKIWA